MLQVYGLSKYYNATPLFEDVTFTVGKGERIGLVGKNGSGKSTLLKIICGFEEHDDGGFNVPRGYKIGYLDQHIKFTKDTLIEECCQSLGALAQTDAYKAEKILFGLGFVEADLGRRPTDFSGGFQLRINLTKTLLQEPDLLLLDEPTNYLDILSLRWLRRFLKSFRGETILITHDRGFMDSVTTHTMGIYRGKLYKTDGPTTKYYAQLSIDEEVHERTRIKQEKKVKELQQFVDRFKAKASKATQAKSKMRQIERMKEMDEIRPEYKLGFRFSYSPLHAKSCMNVEDLAFSYTNDAKDNLFSGLSFQVKSDDRLAVIGKNGKGKTTLLNVLAQTVAQTAGEVRYHPGVRMGYYQQTNRKELNPANTVAQEIASANTDLSTSQSRAICGAMMFSGDLADKKISVLSGGEQSRVLLGKILAHPANLLLLDEPTNHLDMDSVQTITQELKKFPGGVILVTHDEEMLRELATKLVIFHEGRAEVFLGTYDEFLETVGWEEEASEDEPSRTSTRERAADAGLSPAKKTERELKRLQKEYEALEKNLVTLEEKISGMHVEAAELAMEKPGSTRIEDLYHEIGKVQSEIDDGYRMLDELISGMDALRASTNAAAGAS